jgi:hypothetical protein
MVSHSVIIMIWVSCGGLRLLMEGCQFALLDTSGESIVGIIVCVHRMAQQQK